MWMWTAIGIYMLIINLIGFEEFWRDKRAARRHLYRVSEKRLFLIGVFGGAFASFIAMLTFRHKTKHWYFMWGMPILIVIWSGILMSLARIF